MNNGAQEQQVVTLVPLLSVSTGDDLSELVRHWRMRSLPHRIVEENGGQVIYGLSADFEEIKAEFDSFMAGTLVVASDGQSQGPASPLLANIALSGLPVTLGMIVLSVLGFFIARYNLQPFFDLMVIQTVDTSGVAQWLGLPVRISIEEFLTHGHYWRLLTPIFLHFSWVHIVFNMLWLWELGRRIEQGVGSLHLLMVILFIGIASNLWQADSTPYADFGGMSGVIYGLLAYCWVFSMLARDERFKIPNAVYVLMIGTLLIGYAGLFDSVVRMANTAHLMGLVYGLLIAIPSAFIFRLRS